MKDSYPINYRAKKTKSRVIIYILFEKWLRKAKIEQLWETERRLEYMINITKETLRERGEFE